MLWVQWLQLGRVHMTENRLKTICNRPIPSNAVESAKPPRDKGKLCQHCLKVEKEESKYRHLR